MMGGHHSSRRIEFPCSHSRSHGDRLIDYDPESNVLVFTHLLNITSVAVGSSSTIFKNVEMSEARRVIPARVLLHSRVPDKEKANAERRQLAIHKVADLFASKRKPHRRAKAVQSCFPEPRDMRATYCDLMNSLMNSPSINSIGSTACRFRITSVTAKSCHANKISCDRPHAGRLGRRKCDRCKGTGSMSNIDKLCWSLSG